MTNQKPMTPSERAEKIYWKITGIKPEDSVIGLQVCEWIAAELEAVRMEERQACAKILEEGHRSPKCVDPDDCPFCCFSKAIRARGDK